MEEPPHNGMSLRFQAGAWGNLPAIVNETKKRLA